MSKVSVLGRVRGRVMTPHLREVDPNTRGFHPWADGEGIVKPVGTAFLTGYRIAMEQRGAVEAMRALQELPAEWQGFAAEGAGMAMAIRDAITPWRNEFHKLVSVSGGRHSYMMHVGLGWALARLPEKLWPDLSHVDPAVAGLVLDGYGFHEVFFNTETTLRARDIEFPLNRWPGDRGEARQQLHQGVGRGMWFVAGGSPDVLNEMISEFPQTFTSSLWAGVGLAAAYAGGRGEDTLKELLGYAGPDAKWVMQGCAFAAEARHRAGTTNAHTALASEAMCALTVDDLVQAAAVCAPSAQAADSGNWRIYEQWRTALAASLSIKASAAGAVSPNDG